VVAERDAATWEESAPSTDGYGRMATRPPLRPVIVALLLGGLLGAALGVLLGARQVTSKQAVTVLSILPSSAVTGDAANAGQQDVTSFIQGELIVLNGQPLREKVQEQLHLASSPDVSSTQVGQTDVVNVTAKASTGAQAASIARGLADAYGTQRRQQITRDVSAALATIDQQIISAKAGIKAAPGTGTTGGTSQGPAFQAELQRLLAVGSTLQLSQSGLGRVVTELEPPVVSGPPGLSAKVTRGAAGLLLGALLGLALLLLRQRLSDKITTAAGAAGGGVDVLLPELPRLARRALRRGTSGRAVTATRLLAARVAGGSGSRGSVLVLVSVGPRTGTSTVTDQLAAEIAQQRPVLVIRASEAVRPATRGGPPGLTDLPALPSVEQLRALARPGKAAGVTVVSGGTATSVRAANTQERLSSHLLAGVVADGSMVLVDAPSLADSPLALSLAAAGHKTVLVVGKRVTRRADVQLAVQLFHAQHVALLGALVTAPRRRLRRAPVAARTGRPAEQRVATPEPVAPPAGLSAGPALGAASQTQTPPPVRDEPPGQSRAPSPVEPRHDDGGRLRPAYDLATLVGDERGEASVVKIRSGLKKRSDDASDGQRRGPS